MSRYKICILPGDGIGPEVIRETVKILETLPINFEFVVGEIGYECYRKIGTPLPDETIAKVEEADATLFGAITTPPSEIQNYFSPILYLRKHFDLYANVRPCISDRINLIIIRENDFATTHLIPEYFNAIGAYSLLEPQPKFSPAIMTSSFFFSRENIGSNSHKQ